ncbi:MAG: hypothetical protein PHR15_07395 [Atopobiaceae bacterium]|nr:hypothetical protein [Atopobiaceae bacterium]MCH4215112.1 hypothetical protein [Atopobiaceae bacterium]MCH4277242.1 hypothetical protein [Atopobiaceae bacterium]MCI1226770.1 hypothetical protein [Atopobiaceae bacterium]MDD3177220.1 hypothetical protein [Atopobiaceae bacterium]
MSFAMTTTSAEKKDLAAWPSLTSDDGSPNLEYLSEAGDWFDDHFAFRNELVDLDATIKKTLFGTSATDNVVVGDGGWLYYAGTLKDYQCTHLMTDHGIRNAAHNLSLAQEYVESQGSSLIVVVPPDKSTLYPQNMPYYEVAGEGQSNLDRLVPALSAEGVSYVDLSSALSAAGGTLYFERDSHWTNAGALVAYNAILDAAGTSHETYANAAKGTDDTHVGDIDEMLTPLSATAESQPSWEAASDWSYTNDASDVTDGFITTSSDVRGANGRLLMFRDSFGNALLPFMAANYADATFSKRVPYDIAGGMEDEPDLVVIERTERHLSSFASDPAYVPAPERQGLSVLRTVCSETTLDVSQNGPYYVLQGTYDDACEAYGENVYLRLTSPDGTSRTYEAYRVSTGDETAGDADSASSATGAEEKTDDGYRAYLSSDVLESTENLKVDVLIGSGTSLTCIYDVTL